LGLYLAGAHSVGDEDWENALLIAHRVGSYEKCDIREQYE
jgi:hypothetical protein